MNCTKLIACLIIVGNFFGTCASNSPDRLPEEGKVRISPIVLSQKKIDVMDVIEASRRCKRSLHTARTEENTLARIAKMKAAGDLLGSFLVESELLSETKLNELQGERQARHELRVAWCSCMPCLFVAPTTWYLEDLQEITEQAQINLAAEMSAAYNRV